MQVLYERCCGLDVHKILPTETEGSIRKNLMDIESRTSRIKYFYEPVSSSDLTLDLSRGKSPTRCLLSTKFP